METSEYVHIGRSNRRAMMWYAPLVLAFFVTGCDFSILGTATCAPAARTYLYQHDELGDAKGFVQLALEDQYSVFQCGTRELRPPRLEFSDALAWEGARVVPFLSERLSETHDEKTIEDLAHVFYLMHRYGAYSVRNDATLMALMRAKAGSVAFPPVREIVEAEIAQIQSDQP